MAKIIGIHGIGQQFKGPETLRSEWFRDPLWSSDGGNRRRLVKPSTQPHTK